MFRYVAISVAIIVSLVVSGLAISFFWLVEDGATTVNNVINSNNGIVDDNQSNVSDASLLSLKKYYLTDLLEVIDIVAQVITPTPLDQLAAVGNTFSSEPLTTSGVVAWTNTKRIEMNLPVLEESTKLNEVARLRLEDMFNHQYFAHTSPGGVSVSSVSSDSGYDFIVVGENLALGGFPNDEAVVDAWMDSPGHKANILARRYKEIGVAVREGQYKGRLGRMAVQIFGTPLDACFIPSKNKKQEVLANKEKILALGAQLQVLQIKIDGLNALDASTKRQEIRNFNRLAIEHNNLLEVTQAVILEYNKQVQSFNNCAESI